jgi:hypothetical protein
MPFTSLHDNIKLEVGLWRADQNQCELAGKTNCDDSGLYYGTLDQIEPKFCARHFYQEVISCEGTGVYKLVDEK